MATLVVITHEFDLFFIRKEKSGPLVSPYLLFDVIQELKAMGHAVRIVSGPKAPSGDAALYHVDATLAPQEYLDLASRYPRTINFRTGDISKRKISRLLLSKGDAWDGPVIVKANFNNRGLIETLHNRRAVLRNLPPPHPGVTETGNYRVFESIDAIGNIVWSDPSLVVEKFVAEADEDGFALRTWVFMGRRERCTRYVTAEKISKAADVLKYEPVEVPAELRTERARLGFDFGKFDFVLHNGEPILLDANRTPGIAQAIEPVLQTGAPNLAEGLHELLTGEEIPAGRPTE